MRHTANGRLLVLLEIIVDEAQDERGLQAELGLAQFIFPASAGTTTGETERRAYLAHSGFAQQHQLDAARRLRAISHRGDGTGLVREERVDVDVVVGLNGCGDDGADVGRLALVGTSRVGKCDVLVDSALARVGNGRGYTKG